MKNKLRIYVATLSKSECKKIHAEFELWEDTGRVKDNAMMRRYTREWMKSSGIGQGHVVIWMRHLASEVWRRFALPHLIRLNTKAVAYPSHKERERSLE